MLRTSGCTLNATAQPIEADRVCVLVRTCDRDRVCVGTVRGTGIGAVSLSSCNPDRTTAYMIHGNLSKRHSNIIDC
jgi:hypothetical protein